MTRTARSQGERTFTLTAGKGEIQVLEKDGIRLTTRHFELTRGGKTTLVVTWQELADARKPKEPRADGIAVFVQREISDGGHRQFLRRAM